MTNYRRLISYIYAYEGNVKGRNVGFAKLEARGGQCKIQVSVRNIYVGGQDTGVYLLTEKDEIFLGKMFVRGGCGEFRTAVSFDNIAGLGQSMEQCYGLTIHGVADAWRAYTTIWEDAVAHAAEVDLSEATAEKARERESEQIPGSQITNRDLKRAEEEHRDSVSDLIEKEIDSQGRNELPLPPVKAEPAAAEQPAEKQAAMEPLKEKPAAVSLPGTESKLPAAEAESPATESAAVEPAAEEPLPSDSQWHGIPPFQADDTAKAPAKEPAQEQEKTVSEAQKLWEHFQRHYPKIQAFDYSGTCEILIIKPQDIGLLPREMWNYGNNSFLLHGYYNHRYLILARLVAEESGKSGERFLLGVPGHYYNNEKYMASMFGFPNFVLSKMQPANDGRFGYWYTDVCLET